MLSNRYARRVPHRAARASNKIEFRYLNGNLMFPEIHPLTLVFERNSRKPDTSLQL
jgi:hypothetical protein